MITNLVLRVLRRVLSVWEHRIATRCRRARLILDCRLRGVDLELGRNVRFHHPVRVSGAGGRVTIADDVSFSFYGANRWLGPIHLELRSQTAQLRIERGCHLMPGIQILCFKSITLGAETMIGSEAYLIDSDVHDFTPGAQDRPGASKPVVIGERVRLCPAVTVLKGVSVGPQTVVGHKSVVQSNLPCRCVAAGNPARVFLQYAVDEASASPKPL